MFQTFQQVFVPTHTKTPHLSRQTASGMSLQDDDDNMTLSDGDSVSGMDRVAKGMSP